MLCRVGIWDRFIHLLDRMLGHLAGEGPVTMPEVFQELDGFCQEVLRIAVL